MHAHVYLDSIDTYLAVVYDLLVLHVVARLKLVLGEALCKCGQKRLGGNYRVLANKVPMHQTTYVDDHNNRNDYNL